MQCACQGVVMIHWRVLFSLFWMWMWTIDMMTFILLGFLDSHTRSRDIIMVILVKGRQCTSSGENRSACVVSICVTLNRKKQEREEKKTTEMMRPVFTPGGLNGVIIVESNRDERLLWGSDAAMNWVTAYITASAIHLYILNWCDVRSGESLTSPSSAHLSPRGRRL